MSKPIPRSIQVFILILNIFAAIATTHWNIVVYRLSRFHLWISHSHCGYCNSRHRRCVYYSIGLGTYTHSIHCIDRYMWSIKWKYFAVYTILFHLKYVVVVFMLFHFIFKNHAPLFSHRVFSCASSNRFTDKILKIIMKEKQYVDTYRCTHVSVSIARHTLYERVWQIYQFRWVCVCVCVSCVLLSSSKANLWIEFRLLLC